MHLIFPARICNKKWHCISHSLEALQVYKKRYGQKEKEAVSVVFRVRHVHIYLYTCRFVIINDWNSCKSINLLMSKKFFYASKLNCEFNIHLAKTCYKHSQNRIIQKKYGCIDFWWSQNNCSWGSEGPRGSRVMPWWRRECKVLKQFCFFFRINHAKTVNVSVNIG